MSFMTQTAAITSFTPAGGLFMDFTIVMSAGWGRRELDISARLEPTEHLSHHLFLLVPIYRGNVTPFFFFSAGLSGHCHLFLLVLAYQGTVICFF